MSQLPEPLHRKVRRRLEAERHERMRQQALADGSTSHQARWFGIDAANDDPSPEADARRVQADRDVAAWKAPGGPAQRHADYLALCDQVRRDNQRGY